MAKHAFALDVQRAIAALGAAARAAGAIEARRAPRSDDLRTLGIDPADYRRITL